MSTFSSELPVQDVPVGDPDALVPVVHQSSTDGQWRWQLRSVNHKRIGATTEGYHNADDAIANCLAVTNRSALVLHPGVDIDAISDSFTAYASVAQYVARPVR